MESLSDCDSFTPTDRWILTQQEPLIENIQDLLLTLKENRYIPVNVRQTLVKALKVVKTIIPHTDKSIDALILALKKPTTDLPNIDRQLRDKVAEFVHLLLKPADASSSSTDLSELSDALSKLALYPRGKEWKFFELLTPTGQLKRDVTRKLLSNGAISLTYDIQEQKITVRSDKPDECLAAISSLDFHEFVVVNPMPPGEIPGTVVEETCFQAGCFTEHVFPGSDMRGHAVPLRK
jgi:hypothetical protein